MFYTVGATFRIGLLHLQLDNCVGENKNNIVMAFLASLVNMGVIGVVEVCFMMVGHTHIRLDHRCFPGRPIFLLNLLFLSFVSHSFCFTLVCQLITPL